MGVTRRWEGRAVAEVPHLALAQRQHGLVTRDQLRRTLCAREIDKLVGNSTLDAVFRGVYRIAGTPDAWRHRVRAARLAAGPHSFASFACAAALWMVDGWAPDRIEVTVREARRARIPDV